MKTVERSTKFILLIISFVLLILSTSFGIFPNHWIALLIGYSAVYIIVHTLYYIPEGIFSKRWPSVEGEITKSERSSYSSSATESFSAPVIEYSYTINGKEYKSDRIKIGVQSISSSDRDWAERTIEKYSLGKKVMVYYNPLLPTSAVLETGLNLRLFSLLPFAILAYVFSWIIGAFAIAISSV